MSVEEGEGEAEVTLEVGSVVEFGMAEECAAVGAVGQGKDIVFPIGMERRTNSKTVYTARRIVLLQGRLWMIGEKSRM